MNRFARFVLPLCLVLSGFALQKESPTLERARQRWERLTPEDQARFRDRYERYRALSEDERKLLDERAQRMHEAKERLRAEMSDELRAKLDKLDPRKRDMLLNEIVQNEIRERGARIREKMPAELLERLENAEPAARARCLADFQQRAREHATREAIDKLGAKLGLTPAEVEDLKHLPGPERSAKVLELSKRLTVQEVGALGLPEGLSDEEWKSWRTLPPGEFVERVQRHRHEHGWRGGARVAGDEHGERREGPPPMPHELMEALRPRAEDVLRFSDLPANERRQRLDELRRSRVLEYLRQHGQIDDARFNELSQLSEPQLRAAVREILLNLPFEGRGERRGRGGPSGRVDPEGPSRSGRGARPTEPDRAAPGRGDLPPRR